MDFKQFATVIENVKKHNKERIIRFTALIKVPAKVFGYIIKRLVYFTSFTVNKDKTVNLYYNSMRVLRGINPAYITSLDFETR